jgi:hypothetical protein
VNGHNTKYRSWFPIIALAVIATSVQAQSWNIGVGGATDKVLFGALSYQHARHHYYIGVSYQFSNTEGDEKVGSLSIIESDYGSPNSMGDKYYTVDLGYGYNITDPVEVFIEASVGQKTYFSNYTDPQYSGTPFHVVDHYKTVGGIGFGGNYSRNDWLTLGASYHTLRQLGIVIRFTFVHL